MSGAPELASEGIAHMALRYQIIEINLDADGNEINRLPAWSSFDTIEQAVARIQIVLSRCRIVGFEATGNYWWGTAVNGDRLCFTIEGV